jgi:hypothetical protein
VVQHGLAGTHVLVHRTAAGYARSPKIGDGVVPVTEYQYDAQHRLEYVYRGERHPPLSKWNATRMARTAIELSALRRRSDVSCVVSTTWTGP